MLCHLLGKFLSPAVFHAASKLEHFGFSVIAAVELMHIEALKGATFAGLLVFGLLACIGEWLGE